jgi:hypothetical protein
VQHRPTLRGVHHLAGEQPRPRLLHTSGPRQVQRHRQVVLGPRLLGEVDLQAGGRQRQPFDAVGLGREQALDASPARNLGGRGKGRPGGVDIGQTDLSC